MNGISLIMATVGRVQEIDRLMESLSRQTMRDFELIVVDQNPDDRLVPVVDKARKLGISVRHVRQAVPNLSLARNAGLAHAAREVIAFPDDDCWYEPDALACVVERLAQQDAPQGVIIRWQEASTSWPDALTPRTLRNDKWRRFEEPGASSISLFFTRPLMERVGPFDLIFGVHSWFGAGEETDLMFRVMASGARVVYLPGAVVHHAYASRLHLPIPKAFHIARGRARGTGALYAKHQLSSWVIIRGLVSPLGRVLLNIHRPTECAAQLGASLGRLEGYLRWCLNRGVRT